MEIHIESSGAKTGEKIESLVRRKFSHLSKRYDRIMSCDVILRKEKNDVAKNFNVEARMNLPGTSLFAADKNESFEMAIKNVVEGLERQLSSRKEQLDERR